MITLLTSHANVNSLSLTRHQKNKAVTIRYNDVDNFDVDFWSEGGTDSSEYTEYFPFNFVFSPLLLCAKTIGAKDPTIVPGKTTTTTSTTTTPQEKKCLFIIPIVNWCFPKFW